MRKSTANAPHLRLAPAEQSAEPATQVQRVIALADGIDVRTRALAGLDRIDAMDLDELDALADLVTGAAYIKRHTRPNLRLVTDEDDLNAIVDAAMGEARSDDDAELVSA